MLVIENILVATDFGECAANAMAHARAIAHSFGARLHVMHVFEPGLPDTFAGPGADITVDLEVAERQLLEEAVTDDDRTTLRAKLIFVELRKVPDAIAEYAKRRRIDLVVIGTHGRRGLTRALLGSVAEQVVRTAPCPVLTVREHARSFIASDLPAVVQAAQNGVQ